MPFGLPVIMINLRAAHSYSILFTVFFLSIFFAPLEKILIEDFKFLNMVVSYYAQELEEISDRIHYKSSLFYFAL